MFLPKKKNYRAIETTTISPSVPEQNFLFLSKRRTPVEGIFKKCLKIILVSKVNEVNTEGKSQNFVLVNSYYSQHEATVSHKQNYVGEDSWRTEGMVDYYGTALREGYCQILTCMKHL
jgi:hypothetical protein